MRNPTHIDIFDSGICVLTMFYSSQVDRNICCGRSNYVEICLLILIWLNERRILCIDIEELSFMYIVRV